MIGLGLVVSGLGLGLGLAFFGLGLGLGLALCGLVNITENRQVVRDITHNNSRWIIIGQAMDKNIVHKSKIGAESSWSSDNRIKMQ